MSVSRCLTFVAVSIIAVACARPPQAEIDAAKNAIELAETNKDVLAFAPDALKLAKTNLERMTAELTAGNYNDTKVLALKVSADAVKAVSDAAEEKAKRLLGKPLDALELFIVHNALNGAFNPIQLSQAVVDRFSKYNGKVQIRSQARGTEVFRENGSSMKLSSESILKGSVSGDLAAEIEFLSGEVGIEKGNLLIAESTKALVDGIAYSYSGGIWRK